MKNREDGVAEIFNRISTNRATLGADGLKGLQRPPITPVSGTSSTKYPHVFMFEGQDQVIARSGRDAVGYPLTRELEIILEIVTKDDYDIRQLYRDLRIVILADPKVANYASVNELRAEGPFPSESPNSLVMQLVLGLTYKDEGL